MRTMPIRPLRHTTQLIMLLPALFTSGLAIAATAIGDPLPPITLADQHGNPRSIDDQTRLLLFTSDMGGGKVIRKLLDERADAAQQQAAANTAYLSDVSNMPAMIRRLMALPAMRKRPYPIMLDIDGVASADLPRQKGSVTIIGLDKLTVIAINSTASPDELATALGLSEAAQPPAD